MGLYVSCNLFPKVTLHEVSNPVIALDKRGYQVNISLIPPQKHMMWVLVILPSQTLFGGGGGGGGVGGGGGGAGV